MRKNFFNIPFKSLFFNSKAPSNQSPKSTNKQRISEISVKYNELLLKKRFKLFLIFYLSNIFFIIFCFFFENGNNELQDFHELRVLRLTLIIIMVLMLVSFTVFLDRIIRSPSYKIINWIYFFILNILNTIISIEFSQNIVDFSLPTSFYYFWMGYRLCSTSIIIKIITNSIWISTPTLVIELIYIIYKFTDNIDEIYKSIFYSIIIFFIYTYFFYIYEQFLYNDSQIKHYQKEDNKLFKKMLNRLPESLIILNQSDHLFYSNYNAKSFIQNCSTIFNPCSDRKGLITIQELFKNLKLVFTDEEVKEEIKNDRENSQITYNHIKEEFILQKDLLDPPKNNYIDNFLQISIVILLIFFYFYQNS